MRRQEWVSHSLKMRENRIVGVVRDRSPVGERTRGINYNKQF